MQRKETQKTIQSGFTARLTAGSKHQKKVLTEGFRPTEDMQPAPLEYEDEDLEINAAEAMAESCGNDIRQVLNSLQMIVLYGLTSQIIITCAIVGA